MKKRYISCAFFIVMIGSMSFVKSESFEIKKYRAHFPNGVDANLTGSPDSENCSNCHGPDVQSGASMNVLKFNNSTTLNYQPGASYVVSLEMSVNPAARGFNAVALDGLDQSVGTFVTIPDNVTDGARASNGIATHNTNSNTADWKWTWIAPSTNVGPVTFYVATLKSDGVVPQNFITYLSQHIVGPDFNGVSKVDKLDRYNFSAGYSSENNSVLMKFSSLVSGEMTFNLVDLTGRSVFYYKMGQSKIGVNQEKIVLPDNIKNGMYVVNMSVNNNYMEQQIQILR